MCATPSRFRARQATRGIEAGIYLISFALEAEIGDDVPALILDDVGTLRALERSLGLFVAERRGFLVIDFGGACILRSAASVLGERAHPLQCPGMILRGRLFKQCTRRDVVLFRRCLQAAIR